MCYFMKIDLEGFTFDNITFPNTNKTINCYSEDGKNMLCKIYNITVINENKNPFNIIKYISLPILMIGPSLFILSNLLTTAIYKPKPPPPPLIPRRFKRERFV